MKVICNLSEEEFNNIFNSEDVEQKLKERLNIQDDKKYNVGTTLFDISSLENVNKYDVVKNTWKGRDYYYIVTNPINSERAFTYSFYTFE